MNITLFFQIFELARKSSLLDVIMIFGAKYLVFVTLALVILLTIRGSAKEKKPLVLIFIGILVAEILIKLTRVFFFEPRPYITFNLTPLITHIPDASFPSEHTTLMAILFWAYAFYYSKLTWIFLTLMLWVGFARIFVGVHYPLDILGGMFYGFLAITVAWQIKIYLKKILFQN